MKHGYSQTEYSSIINKGIIIVLGASVGQLPLIKLCKQLGYYVVAVSPKGKYVGLPVADEILYEDVSNKEAILEFAQKKTVVGIVSDQLDMAVPIVSFLSDKLNLRGIKPEVAKLYTNKAKMRLLAKRAGVEIPYFIEVKSMAEALKKMSEHTLMSFPLLLKPVEGEASHGIHVINSQHDLMLHFEDAKRWSKSGSVIIEQYIYGQEYVVESYTHNYNPTVLAVGKREYFDIKDTFIPRATIFKDSFSANSEIEKKLKDANNKIIKTSMLEFGITHGEFICEKDTNKIYLVEIAARGGGVQTSSDIIPLVSGINIEELLIKDILGIYDYGELKMKRGVAGYICYLLPEGKIVEINGCKDVERLPGVRTAFWNNIGLGDLVGSINDKASRKGPIIIEGETRDECYQLERIIRETLDIKVETNKGRKGIIWN